MSKDKRRKSGLTRTKLKLHNVQEKQVVKPGIMENGSIINSSANPNTTDIPLQQLELTTYIFKGFILTPICIFGIIGNVLSFIVLSKPKMKSSISLSLKALATAD